MIGHCVERVIFEVEGVEFEAYCKGCAEINNYSEVIGEIKITEISEMYSIGGEKENLEIDYFELYKSDTDFHSKVEEAIKDKLAKTGNWELKL